MNRLLQSTFPKSNVDSGTNARLEHSGDHLLRENISFLNMSRIVIKASDVAAIIGQNKFKPCEDVFNDMWKKYSPQNFNSKTKLDVAKESMNKSDTAEQIVESARAKKAKNSTEVQITFKEAELKIKNDPKLSPTDKQNVIDHLKSQVFTVHGTRNEDETADKTGLQLKKDNTFYSLYIATHDDRDYVVIGRVDRIETLPDGSQILVEIKNRTNKLFRKVYPSEYVQVQVYLDMLNLEKAKLIEQYNDEINIMEVTRDKEFFETEVMPKLEDFCFQFSRVIL